MKSCSMGSHCTGCAVHPKKGAAPAAPLQPTRKMPHLLVPEPRSHQATIARLEERIAVLEEGIASLEADRDQLIEDRQTLTDELAAAKSDAASLRELVDNATSTTGQG